MAMISRILLLMGFKKMLGISGAYHEWPALDRLLGAGVWWGPRDDDRINRV